MNCIRIAEQRKLLGLSQEELATKLNISQKSISKYERGDRRPSYEVLVAMASLFGVSVDYLLGNDSDSETTSSEAPGNGCENSINYWIAKTGLGNNEIAKQLGISEDLLADYIQLKVPIPYPVLSALSEICNVSTDCLLGIIKASRRTDFDNVLPFKYNYEIAKRIRKLCSDNSIDTTSSFLENLLCLSSQEVFYLIEYGFVPHVDTIIKLAEHFNVSCDYLLCVIDEKTENALSSFHRLNEDNQDIIVGDMKKYLKEQRYEETVAAETSMREAK
nr:MAG TPA: repressor protein [Caudoviricetes sp.]